MIWIIGGEERLSGRRSSRSFMVFWSSLIVVVVVELLYSVVSSCCSPFWASTASQVATGREDVQNLIH